jgi:hypothetical protein
MALGELRSQNAISPYEEEEDIGRSFDHDFCLMIYQCLMS